MILQTQSWTLVIYCIVFLSTKVLPIYSRLKWGGGRCATSGILSNSCLYLKQALFLPVFFLRIAFHPELAKNFLKLSEVQLAPGEKNHGRAEQSGNVFYFGEQLAWVQVQAALGCAALPYGKPQTPFSFLLRQWKWDVCVCILTPSSLSRQCAL